MVSEAVKFLFYFLTNCVPSSSPSFQNVHNSEAYRALSFPAYRGREGKRYYLDVTDEETKLQSLEHSTQVIQLVSGRVRGGESVFPDFIQWSWVIPQ